MQSLADGGRDRQRPKAPTHRKAHGTPRQANGVGAFEREPLTGALVPASGSSLHLSFAPFSSLTETLMGLPVTFAPTCRGKSKIFGSG